MTISPISRQWIVAVSPLLAAFSVGGVVGYPGVLLHQLRTNNSSIHLDLNTASWIGSIHGLAGIPSILMPTLMQWKGRKFAFITACIIIITGWIVVFSAKCASTILVSELFHGLGTNSILAVSLLSMSEMITPRFRNISMLSFSVIQSLGMASVGIMARYVYWKTISVIMIMPMILALCIAFIWPESPYWLACKGKYDKCERAFKLLRGTDDISKKELSELIDATKGLVAKSYKKRNSTWKQKLSQRDFYLPSIHMFVLLNAMYWSGVMPIIIYSKQIIEAITSDAYAAHITGVLIYSTLIIGYSITALLIRLFKHKTVLLTSIFFTSIGLLAFSSISFLQSTTVVSKSSYLGLITLICIMVSGSLGLDSIVFTVAAELTPVRHRGVGGALFVIYTCLLHTTALKSFPYLVVYLNISGTFFIYAINAMLSGILIWKYVPETKGRTLQELENYYMYGNFVNENYEYVLNEL